MRPVTKSLRVIALGIALLAASGPVVNGLGIATKPISAAYAFKKLGGADKIGWARKFRSWCKENAGRPQCDYVNSLVQPKCTHTRIRNFKDACRAGA